MNLIEKFETIIENAGYKKFEDNAVYLAPNWTKKITIEIDSDDIADMTFDPGSGIQTLVENNFNIYQREFVINESGQYTIGIRKSSDNDLGNINIEYTRHQNLQENFGDTLPNAPGIYISCRVPDNFFKNSAGPKIIVYNKNKEEIISNVISMGQYGSQVWIEDSYDEFIIKITKNESQE